MVVDHSQTTTAVGESQPHSRANSVKGPKAEYDAAGSKTGKPTHHSTSAQLRIISADLTPSENPVLSLALAAGDRSKKDRAPVFVVVLCLFQVGLAVFYARAWARAREARRMRHSGLGGGACTVPSLVFAAEPRAGHPAGCRASETSVASGLTINMVFGIVFDLRAWLDCCSDGSLELSLGWSTCPTTFSASESLTRPRLRATASPRPGKV